MKKSATLPQAMKILALFDGMSAEEVQTILGSGYITELIRNGSLGDLAARVRLERNKSYWQAICKIGGMENIRIVVPHERNASGKFEVAVFLGEPERPVYPNAEIADTDDKAKLVFKTEIDERLSDESICPFSPDKLGIGGNVSRYDKVTRTTKWNAVRYDMITPRL